MRTHPYIEVVLNFSKTGHESTDGADALVDGGDDLADGRVDRQATVQVLTSLAQLQLSLKTQPAGEDMVTWMICLKQNVTNNTPLLL